MSKPKHDPLLVYKSWSCLAVPELWPGITAAERMFEADKWERPKHLVALESEIDELRRAIREFIYDKITEDPENYEGWDDAELKLWNAAKKE